VACGGFNSVKGGGLTNATVTGGSGFVLTGGGGIISNLTVAAGVTVDGTQDFGSPHERYTVVRGGLAITAAQMLDSEGRPIDGPRNGQPGGDYVTNLDRGSTGPTSAPSWVSPARGRRPHRNPSMGPSALADGRIAANIINLIYYIIIEIMLVVSVSFAATTPARPEGQPLTTDGLS
jgi:hypothetical protein